MHVIAGASTWLSTHASQAIRSLGDWRVGLVTDTRSPVAEALLGRLHHHRRPEDLQMQNHPVA
jgi:hypothetical protein